MESYKVLRGIDLPSFAATLSLKAIPIKSLLPTEHRGGKEVLCCGAGRRASEGNKSPASQTSTRSIIFKNKLIL